MVGRPTSHSFVDTGRPGAAGSRQVAMELHGGQFVSPTERRDSYRTSDRADRAGGFTGRTDRTHSLIRDLIVDVDFQPPYGWVSWGDPRTRGQFDRAQRRP